MFKIIKYTFIDLMRSSWSYVYLLFYLLISFTLFFLNADISKSIITLMNIVIVITPLIACVFGIVYYYNSEEFIVLLLAQPMPRYHIFLGQYIGVALSLTLSLIIGLGIPFTVYGILFSSSIWNFATLIIISIFLNFIFVGISYNIAIRTSNKVKGFAFSILVWLLLTVIYDGALLIALLMFKDYPLENFALCSVFLNPIDLSRILILLKLDISALMGYTGSIFKKVFNTNFGMFISTMSMLFWISLSAFGILRSSQKKDF